MSLDFDQLRKANVARCETSFHSLKDWSLTDWATAMAGECGEACNVIKKIRRAEFDTKFVREEEKDRKGMIEALAYELADIIIYVDLLAAREDIDLGEAVKAKFNKKSDEVGTPIKL